MESTIASRQNWTRMIPGVAPMDILRPISLMRSVTETSMMFMIPMPPTTSVMTEKMRRSVPTIPVTDPIVFMISVVSRVSKSLSW